MFKVICLLAVCVSISLFARKGEMKVNPKTAEPKRGDIVCCEINHLNTDTDLRVTKICVGKGKTVIEMEYTKITNACTILESNILVDNNGKQYLPTFHTGLANCPNLTKSKPGHKFYWGFEILDQTASSLKLKENEKMHPDMIPIQLTEFNIAHCKW